MGFARGLRYRALVRHRTRTLADRGEDRRKHIRIVITNLIEPPFFRPLKHGAKPLESHPRIDVLRRKRRQLAVGRTVELNEHQVPQLDHPSIARVDQLRTRFIRRQVDVNFAARPAGSGLAHLPEIVLLIAGMDVRGIDIRDGPPELGRLSIRLESVRLVAFKVGGVESILVDAPYFGQQLPRPLDGLFFEIVAERPVPQHLEKRVVIGILPDVVEIVVLTAGPNALLRVRRPAVRSRADTEEHVLELVHPRVGEHQGGVVQGHNGRRGHDFVALGSEKIQKLLSNLNGSHQNPANCADSVGPAAKIAPEMTARRRPDARPRGEIQVPPPQLRSIATLL